MRRFVTYILLSAATAMIAAHAQGSECPAVDPAAPRTLILALDGVPYRAMRTAREMGAFAGWGSTRPLVSTFPSMTNVGFAAILSPFGTGAVPGYELRRYDPTRNRISGGGVGDVKFEWRSEFDLQQTGFWDKVGIYMTPRAKTMNGMKKVREFVLNSSEEILMVLVSSTDNLTHVYGEAALVRVLLQVSEEIETTRRLHEQLHGRPIDVVMFSDHGNSGHKVKRSGGVKKALRGAGLRPAKRLEHPTDVVPVTYGVVGYGVLYLADDQAATAARAVVDLPGVHIAAWRSAPGEVRVASEDAEAVIDWREEGPERSFRYRTVTGDPLEFEEERAWMESVGLLDEQGFGRRSDWFEATAFQSYPDALARIVDSLDGVWVSNAATVIFSHDPGYGWGAKSVEIGAWLRGGRLEQTHGSLERDSSWGFFLVSDPELEIPRAVQADRALSRWAERSHCASAARLRLGPPAHVPRINR